jgi:hypothetical protein
VVFVQFFTTILDVKIEKFGMLKWEKIGAKEQRHKEAEKISHKGPKTRRIFLATEDTENTEICLAWCT